MKRPFLDTLKELKGKTFHYAGKTYRLLDYSVNDHLQRVTITTDLRSFEKSYDSIDEFLYMLVQDFEQVPAAKEERAPEKQSAVVRVEPAAETETVDVYQEHSNMAKDLITILRDNITKVQQDKSYIPQAQAVNNNVNSIINVTKLQLDVYKQFKGKKNGVK